MKLHSTYLLALLTFLSISNGSVGQPLTGTKDIPGIAPTGYATLALAIVDLNANGVGAGGVTFNIAAGYTETFTGRQNGLITLNNASPNPATPANPIIFQKSGAGLNPLISGTTTGQTGSQDYVLGLSGTDFVTFDGIDVQDLTGVVEFGYVLFNASVTDGSNAVVIKNCKITLNGSTNPNVVGINQRNTIESSNTSLTITALAGAQSNNKFFGNTIVNSFRAIILTSYNDPTSPYNFADRNNEIGVEGGNTIVNLGGGAALLYGIRGDFQRDLKIANNTFTGTITGGTLGQELAAFFLSPGTNANLDVYNNSISMSYNGTTQNFIGILLLNPTTGTTNIINIRNNEISGCTYPTATTGSFTGIEIRAPGIFELNVRSNRIINNTHASNTTANAGSFTGINMTVAAANSTVGATTHIDSNLISGNVRQQLGSGSGNDFYINIAGSAPTLTVSNNRIDNNSTQIPGPTVAIRTINSIASKTIANDTISNISSAGNITGIEQSGSTSVTTVNIFKSRISGLSSSGATANVYGINSNGALEDNVYNNYVSELRLTNLSGTGNITGINIGSIIALSSAARVYHNTVYLDGTAPGGNFGSMGLSVLTNATSSDVRNNNIVNVSTPTGTGRAITYAATPSLLLPSSGGNNLYVTTPGINNHFLFMNSTSNATTNDFDGYLALLGVAATTTTDTTELPPFISVAASPYNLRINGNIATKLESGGVAASTPINVADDYDGEARYPNAGYPNNSLAPATAPDIGADEFAGLMILPLKLITFTGKTENNNNYLQWVTAQEENTLRFDIQYSRDGRTFDVIGSVSAAGNSPIERSYSFTHTNISGDAFYRLKMVDIDNSFTYSRVIRINGSITGLNIDRVSPIPFTSEIVINMSSDKARKAIVLLTDVQGRDHAKQNLQIQKGTGIYSIRGLDGLANGTYLLSVVTDEGNRIVQKLQK